MGFCNNCKKCNYFYDTKYHEICPQCSVQRAIEDFDSSFMDEFPLQKKLNQKDEIIKILSEAVESMQFYMDSDGSESPDIVYEALEKVKELNGESLQEL